MLADVGKRFEPWTEAEIKARNRSAPIRDVMRFHLVYNGKLAASSNSPKPAEVVRIRQELSPQLANLWDTHPALQTLKQDGARPLHGPAFIGDETGRQFGPREMVALGLYEDLCTPIPVAGASYMPLVRKSLDLSCEIDILFLRQQEPGDLISQGGDIDGRIKLLLDALRMPTPQEQERATQQGGSWFCLMESDTLVSRLNVDTDRLLIPRSTHPHEVHLVMEVSLNVLRVAPHNTCLL